MIHILKTITLILITLCFGLLNKDRSIAINTIGFFILTLILINFGKDFYISTDLSLNTINLFVWPRINSFFGNESRGIKKGHNIVSLFYWLIIDLLFFRTAPWKVHFICLFGRSFNTYVSWFVITCLFSEIDCFYVCNLTFRLFINRINSCTC